MAVLPWQQHPCRRLQVVNAARERRASNAVNLCRIEERRKVVTSSQLSK
jgi:hypothetical protein